MPKNRNKKNINSYLPKFIISFVLFNIYIYYSVIADDWIFDKLNVTR